MPAPLQTELPNAQWEILVDWGRDGSFAGALDNITPYVESANWSLGMSKAYQLVADESKASIELFNENRRFSPENASGPLFGSLVPQCLVLIRETYNGVTTTHWRGWIERIEPTIGTAGPYKAILICRGWRWMLDKTKVYLNLMTNVTAEDVLEAVLQQVYPPPADIVGNWALGLTNYSEIGETTFLAALTDAYDFEVGQEVFAYVGDNWGDGVTAINAVEDVVSAERGRFFFARDGRATLFNRSNFQINLTSLYSITDNFEGIDYKYGASLANIVTARVSPRAISSSAGDILWQLDKVLVIGYGQTKTIRANYADDSGAQISGQNIQTPSSAAGTLVGARLNRLDMQFEAGARSAKIILTNASNLAGDVVITSLVIKGTKISAFKTVELAEEDADSRARYGPQNLSLNLGLLDDEDTARNIVGYELLRHKDPRGEAFSISLRNYDTEHLLQQLYRTVGDRITVAETQTSYNSDNFIIGEAHSLTNGMKEYRTTWFLESADAGQVWLLGETGHSVLGETTFLGL